MCQGIGNFTIADNAVVTAADLGVNFFLEESNLGHSRAKCCAELLQELNPDVEGDSYFTNEVRGILGERDVAVRRKRGDICRVEYLFR